MFKFFFDKNKDTNQTNNNQLTESDGTVKASSSICPNSVHQKSVDLYCKFCNLSVCSKCLKEHSTHSVKVVDIEDEFNECLKASSKLSDNLREFIKAKDVQKITNEGTFKETVELQYKNELEKIANYFRDVHDKLHFKEVELKRELKSHYDNNYEEFTKMISKIDYEIDHSKNLIQTIEKKDGSFDQEKEDKFSLLHRYIHSKNLLERKEEVEEFKYESHSFVESLNKFDDLLRLLEIRNNNAKNKFVYIYGNGAFERLNITNKTLEKIEIKGEKFGTNHGIFKAMVATNDYLYLFKRKNFLKYDPRTQEWTMGSTPGDFDGGDWQSVEYDGKDFIYLFGGIRDGINHSDVSRFNVKTDTFETKIGKTRIPIRFATARIVNDGVYILGGVASESPDPIANLERYDIKTGETTLIRNFAPDGYNELTALCYVPSSHSLYIISREHKFIRYDIATNTIHPLNPPIRDLKQYYTELTYDGDHTIYCINKDNVYEFNMNTNTWSKIETPKFHNFDLYLYSIAYSHKF